MTQGNRKKSRKDKCRRDIKKFSFSQRCLEVWNGLDKRVVEARTISKFKEMLDFLDIETGQHKLSSSHMLQLGK